jgi:hypothetical protein
MIGHARYRVKHQVKHKVRDGEMSNQLNSKGDPSQPIIYQIRLKGHLDEQWTVWFEGLTLTLEDNGDTLLTGTVADQAALYGLLRKVRDLGAPLLSVIRIKPDPADASDVKPQE